jgi:hypothetical protein
VERFNPEIDRGQSLIFLLFAKQTFHASVAFPSCDILCANSYNFLVITPMSTNHPFPGFDAQRKKF